MKHTGIMLLYTLVFNVISVVGYFFSRLLSHNSSEFIWIVFGILHLWFTILFFSFVPLIHVSNDKNIKTDLLLYFIILSILSVITYFCGLETDNWFIYLLLDSAYISDLLSSFAGYFCFYLFTGAIKTYCLYKNISRKTISDKRLKLCVALLILIVVFNIVSWLVMAFSQFT